MAAEKPRKPRKPRGSAAARAAQAAVAASALLASVAGPVAGPDTADITDAGSGRETMHRIMPAALTPREVEVLSAYGLGLERGQVITRLGMAANTLKNHVSTINRKLGSEDARHAALIAYGLGMIELPRPTTT